MNGFPELTGVLIEDAGLRAELETKLSQGQNYYQTGWDYHRAMGQALAGEDIETMKAYKNLRDGVQ